MPANPASTAAPTASRTCAHGASNGSTSEVDVQRAQLSGIGCPGSMSPRSCMPSCRVPDRSQRPPCGIEHERDVVAGVDALDDRTGEPVAPGEHGTAVGTRTPFDALELVDLVAGFAPEVARQVPITLAEQVDDEGRGRQGDAVRPVLLRQPDAETRGIDAALRRKTDQAAVALVSRCRGHDVCRTVQIGDDRPERLRLRAHLRLPRCGEADLRGRPTAGGGLEIDGSAVVVDDLADDREAEARPG